MSVIMNFNDRNFTKSMYYRENYGVLKPYLVGIVMDTVMPMQRKVGRETTGDWQIKIAIFQSEKSSGYAVIKARDLNDLPKGLCRGQILVLKEAIGTSKRHYRTNQPEYVATLCSAVSKYRLALVISEHLLKKDQYRTSDGYLNHDPYCSVTKNLSRVAIDEKMDSYITQLIENFMEYTKKDREELLGIDPRRWVLPVDLEDLYKIPTDEESLMEQRPKDLYPALIVGFWVCKDEKLFEDPGVILELYDGSLSDETRNKSFVEKNYKQAFGIAEQDRRIPTAFVKISKNAFMKYNYHAENLLKLTNKTMNPCGQLINLRRVHIEEDIPVLKGTKNTAMTSSVGYQGYSLQDSNFVTTKLFTKIYNREVFNWKKKDAADEKPRIMEN